MTTKEKLLALFESGKGTYFSGEEIAKQLQISRAAVWKGVKTLRSEGYPIDAVTNKGYCLSTATDILSNQGIQKYLAPQCACLDLVVVPEVSCTNLWVREKAHQGALEGCAIIANHQLQGRGRLGRSFFSPPETGIYLSLLLRPQQYSAQQAVRITTMAAVAVCEAIEAVSGQPAQIKWINDIYVGGKKVCGILTEASFGLENGLVEYAVLGVGINVYPPRQGFPKELESIAGAVFQSPQDDGKNRLAAEFLNRFMDGYTHLEQADYVEKYRARSLVLGREVSVLTGGQAKQATALEIDDACRLRVRYLDGQEESLSSGEVSLKLENKEGFL